MSDEVEKLKARLKLRPKVMSSKVLLSTGSTTLNLACSGNWRGGVPMGTYGLLAGDSDSGKTWLARTMLAEAANNPAFDNHRLIFTDPEHGSLMDMKYFFGKKLTSRLEEREDVETTEQFYYKVDDDLKDGRPFVHVLDSMDALQSEKDQEQFEKEKKASRKQGGAEDVTGSYGTQKAKKNSGRLRVIANKIKASDSILILIAQLRQNIGFGATMNPKVISGGMSLKYYAHLVLWTASKGSIKKKVKNKDRELGTEVLVKVKKNRLQGKKRSALFPIYHSFGIDDVGSCVEYLLEEGHWTASKGRFAAPEFEFSGSKEQLIKKIEEEDAETELRALVGEVWTQIEDGCKVERKKRYE